MHDTFHDLMIIILMKLSTVNNAFEVSQVT